MKDSVGRRPGALAARLFLGLLLVVAGASLSACVVAFEPPWHHEVRYVEGAPEIVADQAPPPVQEEVVTVAPAPDLVWVGGYWGWYGGRYVWVSGGWHRPPRPGAVWVGGTWTPRPGGGHVWVRGRWR